MAMETKYDIFLAHNSKDKPRVRELKAELQRAGLVTWIDEDNLVPGQPWVDGIEQGLTKSKVIAVVIGGSGLGPWEVPEMRAALIQMVRRNAGVIPVLLPGAPQQVELPLFLQTLTWIDCRDGFATSIDRFRQAIDHAPLLNTPQPEPSKKPKTSTTKPDFSARQGYLCPAPEGVDAYYAWRFLGGRGNCIRIIDCEWGWEFGHEDLWRNQGGVVIGTNHTDTNHGTAVLGEFSGDRSGYGIVGICGDAMASAASFLTIPTADVIRQAADRLGPGDIILLEIHRSGPGASGAGQDGYIAIEWWPDDFAAIQYAVARGIIVVEAAGNGARDLDNPIYETPQFGFPAWWSNPFNLANPQSGAVVVGAGAPPPGTHGNDHGPDRSRLDFSNYGSRVDAQGWGREVTTTGYGDLQGGSDRNLWYTDRFSGTSSASPIVVGALGSIQGILKANCRPLLNSNTAAQLLRSTGSPQQDAVGRPRSQRIGNRPDIKQMIGWLFGVTPEAEIKTVEQTQTGGQGNVELNLSGKITINVRSTDVTINVTDSRGKPAMQPSDPQG